MHAINLFMNITIIKFCVFFYCKNYCFQFYTALLIANDVLLYYLIIILYYINYY